MIVGLVYLSIKTDKKTAQEKETQTQTQETTETRSLCYYRSDLTKNNFYDKAWLKLNITGDKVTGEFQHLPAETDSKVGKFEGTLDPLNQESMSRSSAVWWDSMAEGMEVKEELTIKWGDGSATVGFGEMTDRGDGVYVYKNKDNLYWIKSMDQIDCESLDEKLFTEKYIRDNISTIATNKPVLGGTWYAITVNVNTSTKTGDISYEDGHIQSKASFTYTYDKTSNNLDITKFEIKK